MNDQDYFVFSADGISISPDIPKTDAVFNPSLGENDTVHSTQYYVNCENNFNEDEKEIIRKFKLKKVDDILLCKKISQNDKERCLKCYKYVDFRMKNGGIEPFNGQNSIQLDEYVIVIRISPNKSIAFIKSMGKKTTLDKFCMIQMQ
jgi:GTPase Era involved in 16S rRNA processing